MYILGRTQSLSQYPIMQCLNVIHALGFNGAELCLEHPDLAPTTLTPALARDVARRVAEVGLAPHSVSYHKDYIFNDAFFEETCAAIRLTREFNTNIFVFSGAKNQAATPEQGWQIMLDRTRQLVGLAERYNVILAEEFEPDFIVGSTADLHRLFQALPSPHLQANLDIGHVFLCDPDPLAAITSLRGRVVHGHVENMRTGVHRHMIPQEGDMDLPAYIKVLRQIGFGGGLALDLYNYDYEAVAPDALRFLKTCLLTE